MEAPDIFDYLDFRAYLRDFYTFKKTQGRSFSYRAFARRAGFSSPNFLKVVIEGERNLSEEMAEKFAKGCGLGGSLALYFCNLVAFNQATQQEVRERAFERLLAHRKHRGIVEITQEQHAYFSTWYVPAIRELIARADFREDHDWIAAALRPAISPEEAGEALAILERLGLTKRDANTGQLRQSAELITTADETRSASSSWSSPALKTTPARWSNSTCSSSL